MKELQPHHVQAAQSFNSRARHFLYWTEGKATDKAVAELVGESQGNYSAALRGTRGGTLDRVCRWMTTWNAQGFPAMRLEVRGGTAGVYWDSNEGPWT